jgi:hypothetical protein
MTVLSPDIAVGVTLLADHLDAALAHAEDLRDCSLRLAASSRTDAPARAFVERVRRLEADLVGRAVAARARAQALAREEPAVTTIARLYIGGTAALVDALAAIADPSDEAFLAGDGVTAFLHRRGLLEEGRALDEKTVLEVGESYRVADLIELGPLMDLLAAFLDALDNRFDLYREPTGETAVVPAVVARPEVRAD